MSDLADEKCQPSNADMPKTSMDEAMSLLGHLKGWDIDGESKRIVRSIRAKNFMAAMELFNQIARVAEEEQHHPDLHLRAYRHVEIALWTHTVGGLSRNDFVMAAKIDNIINEL